MSDIRIKIKVTLLTLNLIELEKIITAICNRQEILVKCEIKLADFSCTENKINLLHICK